MAIRLLSGYFQEVKITNLRCLTAAGIAAFFLAFAGNVQAIPFSMPDALGSGIRFGNTHNNSGGYEAGRSFERYNRADESPWFGSNLAQCAAQFHNHNWVKPPTVIVPTPPTITSPDVVASNVPDGGSTALMIGAAAVGLVFMKKRKTA